MAYQDLSFSAGETLTATKMNQLANNDKALRDGTGIATGAITADKIDFATSTAYSKISNITTYSSETTMATIEIPSTGKYKIEASVGGIATDDSASQWRIKKGNTDLVTNLFNHITRSGTVRYSGSIATIADCTAGDIITLTAATFGTGTATARDGQYFIATRIS